MRLLFSCWATIAFLAVASPSFSAAGRMVIEGTAVVQLLEGEPQAFQFVHNKAESEWKPTRALLFLTPDAGSYTPGKSSCSFMLSVAGQEGEPVSVGFDDNGEDMLIADVPRSLMALLWSGNEAALTLEVTPEEVRGVDLVSVNRLELTIIYKQSAIEAP